MCSLVHELIHKFLLLDLGMRGRIDIRNDDDVSPLSNVDIRNADDAKNRLSIYDRSPILTRSQFGRMAQLISLARRRS